jgi:protein-S-isoprenylcysteine O-methyltransferase Ste14
MQIIPELEFGWRCAWWYIAAFVLVNLAFMLRYGFLRLGRRLTALPRFASWGERILSLASVSLFGRVMMLYAIFVTLKIDTAWFYLGTFLFAGGLAVYTIALANFSTTPPDQPVVKGAYRFSRHPMQLSAVVMCLGIALATLSWLIALACLLQILLMPVFLKAQERACLEVYGDTYRAYRARTPRYLPGRKLPPVCFINAVGNLLIGRIRFPRDHLGRTIKMEDGQRFTVFRHMTRSRRRNENNAVFVVRFKFAKYSQKANRRLSLIPIPLIAGFPGFLDKIWMVNEETGYWQGVYQWDSEQSVKQYQRSFVLGIMNRRALPSTVTSRAHAKTSLHDYLNEHEER